jgi:hypothetical protein
MAHKRKRKSLKTKIRDVLDAKLLRAIQHNTYKHGQSVFDDPTVKTLMHERDRLLTDRSSQLLGPQPKHKKRSRLRRRK